ncbi:DUF397 domain-containing protein [Actinocatenispora rupis]|uniref:DUF397 domain-containing protein n=1 Tax=Actinocatenispora rupis TaxID=519421 RepID=UPI001942BFE7
MPTIADPHRTRAPRNSTRAVRDSKDPDGPGLVVSPAAFVAFVRSTTTDTLS